MTNSLQIFPTRSEGQFVLHPSRDGDDLLWWDLDEVIEELEDDTPNVDEFNPMSWTCGASKRMSLVRTRFMKPIILMENISIPDDSPHQHWSMEYRFNKIQYTCNKNHSIFGHLHTSTVKCVWHKERRLFRSVLRKCNTHCESCSTAIGEVQLISIPGIIKKSDSPSASQIFVWEIWFFIACSIESWLRTTVFPYEFVTFRRTRRAQTFTFLHHHAMIFKFVSCFE